LLKNNSKHSVQNKSKFYFTCFRSAKITYFFKKTIKNSNYKSFAKQKIKINDFCKLNLHRDVLKFIFLEKIRRVIAVIIYILQLMCHSTWQCKS